MNYVIDHGDFGPGSCEFSSLEDAQATLRTCGVDFEDVALELRGQDIYDERGRVVGHAEH